MALNASQQWRVRTDGAETNGGGFDPLVSGAGIDYTDQAAAQLSLTDVVTTGTTSVTSVTGGFTSAMIGNIIRIVGDAYYAITVVTNSNTITVDRATGTGAAQSAKVGGAFAGLVNFSNGGTGLPTPALATPLAPGHIVYIRGSGEYNPSSSDYDYSAGYWTFPSGDYGTGFSGPIRWIGYYGRPRFTIDGLLFYNVGYHYFENLYTFIETTPSYTSYGLVGSSNAGITTINCCFDANGNDASLTSSGTVIGCEFKNTGGGAAGSIPAFSWIPYGQVVGNYIHDIRGDGMSWTNTGGYMGIFRNIITNCGRYGIARAGAANNGAIVANNVIHGCGSDGIFISNADSLSVLIHNNIISDNGGYGINLNFGSAAANAKFLIHTPQSNAFYSNSSGEWNNLASQPSDVVLTADPFVNAAGGDFSLNNVSGGGISCKGIGFPQTIVPT